MAEINEKIKEFLTVQSSGYGNGYGSGSGSGYGYGNGSGYGSGNGSGYGYGSGHGSGSGDGNGSGSGSGYGSGIKSFNSESVYTVDGVSTIIRSVKGNVAKGCILNIDFTLTECYIVKGRNQFAHGETLRKAQEALENKLFEDMDVEERIALFIEKFELGEVYPTRDFYDWHNKLTGSCEMGRKSFAKDHGIDIETGTMTVQEFIDLTQNSFGSSVIRQLADELGIELKERR